MDKHVTLVAALHIGFGVLGMLLALIVFVAVAGGGFLSGDPEAMAITSIVGSVIAIFLVAVAVPGIIGGIGLLKRHPWARVLVLVIACLELIEVPVGTVIGIYSIWTLLSDETVKLFKEGTI